MVRISETRNAPRAVLRRREGTRFSSPNDDEVGALQAQSAPSERSERNNQDTAGVVELVDTQDLGSCAFGCEGSSPSFGTALNLLASLAVDQRFNSHWDRY
jgi:hypothetical protein